MRLVGFAFAAVLLGACSTSAPPPAAPPQKTIVDAQLKALEKAKELEQQAEKIKAEQDRRIDDAGG